MLIDKKHFSQQIITDISFITSRLLKREYALTGSAAMIAHGVLPINRFSDYDIWVKGREWLNIKNTFSSSTGIAVISNNRLTLNSGLIDIYNYQAAEPNVVEIGNKALSLAFTSENIQFMTLEFILEIKLLLSRPKDLNDIELLRKRLNLLVS